MLTKTNALLVPLALGGALTAGAAFGQSVSFSEIDTDGDGMLSRAELVAAFGDEGADTFMVNADADTDGMVSAEESGQASDMTALTRPLDITESNDEEDS